jgi:ribosomal protein S18 acetylase RimI-like enzyme
MRGFTREGETHVMVSDLSAGVAGDRDLPSEELGDRWLRVMEGLWNIAPEVRPAWLGIIERIGLPAGYALLQEAAAGLGVVDRCWLGLFEIVVEPSQRRRGYGRAITSMLMDWGAGRGARGAYLQVVAANAAAIALYESLGFRYAYTYWYRRDPANSPA